MPSGIRRLAEWPLSRDGVSVHPVLEVTAPLPDTDAAIQAANRELQRLHGEAFELPIVTLTRQRDAALRATRVERDRYESTIDEQDRFIAFLIAEHENQLKDLRFEYESRMSGLEDRVTDLRWQLDEAARRVDDVRDEEQKQSFRVREELDRTVLLLQERTEEARLLRERLHELEQTLVEARARASRPLP